MLKHTYVRYTCPVNIHSTVAVVNGHRTSLHYCPSRTLLLHEKRTERTRLSFAS